MTIAKTSALLAIIYWAKIAGASPIFDIVYDPGVSFSAADKAAIQDAVDFYSSNYDEQF